MSPNHTALIQALQLDEPSEVDVVKLDRAIQSKLLKDEYIYIVHKYFCGDSDDDIALMLDADESYVVKLRSCALSALRESLERKRVDRPVDYPNNLLRSIFQVASLDTLLLLPNVNKAVESLMRRALAPEALKLVKDHFEEGMTAKELADIHSCSTESVYRKLESALHTLRLPQNRRKLLSKTKPPKDIEMLYLTHRAKESLVAEGITTVKELLRYSAEDLAAINGIGQASIKDITEALQRVGLSLRKD